MNKQDIYNYLNKYGIPYEYTEHVAVFTIDEMLECNLPYPEKIAKNLFLRDDKKRNYYLITMQKSRALNIKEFQMRFGTRKLSFASESDLEQILGVKKGAVTPFALLNEQSAVVHFYMDKSLLNDSIGIHPNDNTATVWINGQQLANIISNHGNKIIYF